MRPVSGLIEMTTVTCIGPRVIFTLNTDLHRGIGFTSTRQQLEQTGRGQLIEESEPLQMLTISEPNALSQVCVFEVTN